MSFWSGLLGVIAAVGMFLWGIFKVWLWVLIVPFTSYNLIWIIIPIWMVWFFAEFFQEKKGTTFGNAISNGVIPIYIGIDWLRQITGQLVAGGISWSFLTFGKYVIALLAISFGLFIIINGIRAKKFIHFVGRIREVTYVLLVFSPVIYGVIVPDWKYFVAIVLYFPVFYFVLEMITRYTPTPKIYQFDKGGKGEGMGGLGEDMGGPSEGLGEMPKL